MSEWLLLRGKVVKIITFAWIILCRKVVKIVPCAWKSVRNCCFCVEELSKWWLLRGKVIKCPTACLCTPVHGMPNRLPVSALSGGGGWASKERALAFKAFCTIARFAMPNRLEIFLTPGNTTLSGIFALAFFPEKKTGKGKPGYYSGTTPS